MALNSKDLRSFVQAAALKSLRGAMSEQEAAKIAAQTALGFYTAVRTAKNPGDLLACTEESILSAVATSIGLRLVAGGPNAPAYLVPQRPRAGANPELQFRVNHRGWAIIGLRAGFLIDPVPVSNTDQLRVRGASVKLEQDPDNAPETWAEMRGVVVYVTHIDSGTVISSWVPKKTIAKRRSLSRGGSTWNDYPVEMSMGAAVRYCIARGKLPIDTVDANAAITADADVMDTTAVDAAERESDTNVSTAQTNGNSNGAPALPDRGDDPDGLDRFAQDREKAAQREKVETKTEEAPAAPQAAPTPEVDRGALKARIDELRPQLSDDSRIRINDEYGVPSDVGPWRAGPAKIQSAISAMEASIGGPVDTMQADADAANSQRSMDY